MLNISDLLTEYLNNTTRLAGQYVRIEIKTKTGVVYNISDSELSGGSIKINKKSVSGSSFDIGECYINDATLTIIDKENKYNASFDNSVMTIYFGVSNSYLGLEEEIKLGTYIIPTDTTVRNISSLQLFGDSMLSKFDISIGGVTTSGTPYALVSWCCDVCGVELALTEDEFNSLSDNTGYVFYITEDSSINTYRDVIMYISQIIGGFATDTNDGKLTFKTYNNNNSVFNINNDTIASSKLGDSSYSLDGIGISFNNKMIYVNGDSSSDYLLELDSNPLFENLTEDLVKVILNNIWSKLEGIEFRSFDFKYNGNPAIECGDILSNDVRGISSFITNISWVYHGKSSVSGVVLDKRTKTQSQSVKKAASSGGSASSTNDLHIIRYINTEEYVLGSLETKVVQMYFNLPAGVSPLFTFVMVAKNEKPGIVSLKIVYDNVEMLLKPKYQCVLGYNTLNFTKSFDSSDSDMLHSLSIYANFEEDSNTDITSTSPCIIEAYSLEANVIGYKAASGKPEWTGSYEITDKFNLFEVKNNNINILKFNESVVHKVDEPSRYEITDNFSLFEVKNNNISILKFNESVVYEFDTPP